MGITNFISFVRSEYPSAFVNISKCSNLYVDLNHVLHRACYGSSNQKEIFLSTTHILNYIIAKYRPSNKIYIAADGVAPMAKMILQRKRRLNSQSMSLNCTAHSKFMQGLTDEFKYYVKYLNLIFKLKIELDIDSVDEGELKIRRKLGEDIKQNPEAVFVVYSGDADTILLLSTISNPNIYHAIDKDVIHIQKIIDTQIEKCGIYSKINSTTARHDFVFLNLLMGNDYIPKALYLDILNIWKAYFKLIQVYPKGLMYDSINKEFMIDLLIHASDLNSKCYDKRFTLKNFNKSMYEDYIHGMFWCFNMYNTGICKDYRYMYTHNKSPHYDGLILGFASYRFKESKSTYITKHIDPDLYTVLLMPENSTQLLTTNQIKIYKTIKLKYPIVYEEQRCKTCEAFRLKIKDTSNTSNTSSIKKKFTEHKTEHNILTPQFIESIVFCD